MVLVFTGEGKGKTTAALGLAVRAAGNGQRVCIVQFMKPPGYPTGELKFFTDSGIEIHPCGIGFSWQKTAQEQRECLRNTLEFAFEKMSGEYDLVVLDEINNVFSIKDFDTEDILSAAYLADIIAKYPKNKNLALTGRGAPQEVIAAADLVTEMNCVKHYYNDGVNAKRGLEF